MEILTTSPVMITPWWMPVAIVLTVVCTVCAIIAANEEAYIPTAILSIIAIIAIVVIIFAPHEIPSDKMSYTIEITDPAQYQILVEKGYLFKHLFENKEIYTIIGDVLQ